MARFLAGLYAALVLALIVAAAAAWRLRCEGFGCMGVGVAWFAWAVCFVVVLGVGLLARMKAGPARLTQITWWVQWLLGAAAVAAWVARNVA